MLSHLVLMTAIASGAPQAKTVDEPQRIAVAYLKALAGNGDDNARSYLLGGLTLTAEDFTIPNWKIKKREPVQKEKGAIKAAVAEMNALDRSGRMTLSGVVNLDSEEAVMSLTQEQAEKMLAPTRARAEKFKKRFPVFAYVARVGKDVFWHPSNPWRNVTDKLGDKGDYELELHMFRIEEKQADGKSRVWPLRVLRIKTAAYDSGWKILPASDWDPEF